MRLHRFIGSFDLSGDTILCVDARIVHQIGRVLRLKKGDRVSLCDGVSRERVASLKEISEKKILFELCEKVVTREEPVADVTLYCGILKRENSELIVQKTTELGVRAIIPMTTDRTVKLELKKQRLELIALEAAEQSGRTTVPCIGDVTTFSEATLRAKNSHAHVLFLHPERIEEASRMRGSIGLFVGPEGGWSTGELERAALYRFTLRSLSPLVLRAETAAIVGVYEALANGL